MLIVEFTLNLNHVSGVLADAGIAKASALVPLLIGIFSTLRIFWVIYKEKVIDRRSKRAEDREQVELGTVRPARMASSVDPSLQEGQWWHLVLSMWLPWLSTFERWRKHGSSNVLSPTTRATNVTDDAARRGDYSTLKTSLMSMKGYGDVAE